MFFYVKIVYLEKQNDFKMRRYISVVALMLFATLSLFAGVRSEQEAMGYAKKVLGSSSSVRLFSVEKDSAGVVSFYMFAGETEGFAMIAANSEVPALIAYDPTSVVGKEIPKTLSVMLEMFKRNSASGRLAGSGLRSTKILGHAVRPLLADIQWHQTEPFNSACPLYEEEISAAGCVAISVAQLMAYYRYPSQVQKDIPAYKTDRHGIKIPSIKAGTVIDWKNILHSYDGDYTEKQGNAVADLVRIVGAAYHMDYAVDVSLAEGAHDRVLPTYFGFDKDLIQRVSRRSVSASEWNELLCKDLEAGHPIIFSGQTVSSGHSFICDGVDENGLFHINWGWGSYYNGYFDITVLNPYSNTMVGASYTHDGYNLELEAWLGLVPDDGHSAGIESSQYAAYTGNCLMLDRTRGFLNFWADIKVGNCTAEACVGYMGKDGKIVSLTEPEVPEADVAIGDMYVFGNIEPMDFSVLEAGEYELRLIEREKGGDWYFSNSSVNARVKMTVNSDGTIEVERKTVDLSAVLSQVKYESSRAVLNLQLTNAGLAEYYDVVTVKLWFDGNTSATPDHVWEEGFIVEPENDVVNRNISFVTSASSVRYEVCDAHGDKFAGGKLNLEKKDYYVALTPQEFMGKGTSLHYAFSFGNTMSEPYDNIVYIMFSGKDKMPNVYTEAFNLSLDPGEDISSEYNVVAYSDTLYYWVTDGEKYYYKDEPSRYFIKGMIIAKPLNRVADELAEDLVVSYAGGVLTVEAKKAEEVTLRSLQGTVLATSRLAAGESMSVRLASGVYMLNGTKFLVK